MSTRKPSLYVLKGLPGSGKSTKARELAVETGAILLSRDELRRSLVYLADESVLTCLIGEMAKHLLLLGYSVIIDGWNLHKLDDAIWFHISVAARATLVSCFLDTPLDDCVRRDSLRPEPIGEMAVRAAATEYRPELAKLRAATFAEST